MAASQASSSSNPRKFSEKIALHNQKQAEETRAFDELMSDLTVSRVQFQKLQQLRLAQSRAQYYGGSLPNVNQISSSPSDFQASFHPTDNIRGMRHHGLVERVSRNRLHSPHHRPVEKHGQAKLTAPFIESTVKWENFFYHICDIAVLQLESVVGMHGGFSKLFLPVYNVFVASLQVTSSMLKAVLFTKNCFSFTGIYCDISPYGPVYLSPPSDNSWRRQQAPWSEEKRPGFRLLSALNRTNSDSALHTSASSNKPQDPFVGANQPASRAPRPPQRNTSLHDGEVDGFGEIFSYPNALTDENMLNISKPMPKQLWEAKKVQSLTSRPRSCEVPGIKVFPSSDQNASLSHFQSNLNTGGSLPDLTNLHFPPPLPTPLDPDDTTYACMGTENNTGGLPAAMTHLGISGSPGLPNARSNPSIQATLNNSSLASTVNNHAPPSGRSNQSLHPSLRLASLSNPSLPTAALGSSPRRRQTPVSPLTLTPGGEPNRCVSGQFSPTSPMSMPLNSQGVNMDRSPLSLPPLEPPPPYPLYQEQSQHPLQQVHEPLESPNLQPPSPVPCPPIDLNLANNSLSGFFGDPFFEQQQPTRQGKYLWPQNETYDIYECPGNSFPSTSLFDPNMNLQYSQAAMMGIGGSHGNLQDPFQLRTNFLYSNCGGSVPNIILTDDTSNSLSKDIGSAVAGVSELGFDADNTFQLDDELKLGPLSLDGLNMLSDPEMVLSDPAIEDSFRSDKL
ncbi:CREB-regulated transcription coactivator 3 [Gastrophryne carolinensis]